MKNKFSRLIAVLLMTSSLSTSIYASSQKDGGEEDTRGSLSKSSFSSVSERIIKKPRVAAADMAAEIFGETPSEPLSRPRMRQISQSEMSRHFLDGIRAQRGEGRGTPALGIFP